jgi:hypothetical protein
MAKKVLKLVTTAERLTKEAEADTLVMEGFIDELDAVMEKSEYSLHAHDILAVLANAQLAFQLVHCIDFSEEE